MAGSGKTTLIQRINAHLLSTKRHGYIINMDPAVQHVPYGANIDIRDTVRAGAWGRGWAGLCAAGRCVGGLWCG